MPITEKTRQADEKLREELKHVDPAKLKKVIKILVQRAEREGRAQALVLRVEFIQLLFQFTDRAVKHGLLISQPIVPFAIQRFDDRVWRQR